MVNFIDEETPLSAENFNKLQHDLQDYIKEIIENPIYIKVTNTNPQSITSYSKVILDNIVFNNTNGKITLDNNELVIGSGVNTIEISGMVFVENIDIKNAYLWQQIRKNDVNIHGAIFPTSGTFISGVLPPTPIEVSSGDKISMIADFTSTAGRLREGEVNTYLQVKIIS